MSFIYKLKNILLDILFPPICIGCRNLLLEIEKGNKICQKCLDSIQVYSSFFCPKCKNRVPNQQKTCHQEIRFLLAPATDYQNQAVKNLIWFLKYHKWQSIIKILEPIINNYLDILNFSAEGGSALGGKDFIVMPIPLHPDRLKERGFNQSELIAEIFCKKTGGFLKKDNLTRIRATKNQAELRDINERISNVANCFILNNLKDVENKNIVLVDDVFTTGSTMNEAVKILKSAGAKKIITFVFAKT